MSGETLRVVFASSAAVDARRLLGEAAALARAMDAELAALFVEESDLLRCVALPFSVEVGLVSGAVRPTDQEATRRHLASSADNLRALVAQTAAELGLPWSFTVAHGDIVREALAAASAATVMMAPPRSAVQHAVGSTAVKRGRATVVVLEEPSPEASPPTVLGAATDSPTPADRAWAAAVRFAGGRPDATARTRLEDLARDPAPRVVVVALASVTGSPGLLEHVLASARCPVVLVA